MSCIIIYAFNSQANKFTARLCEASGHGIRRRRMSEAEAPVSELAGRANGSENLFAWLNDDNQNVNNAIKFYK